MQELISEQRLQAEARAYLVINLFQHFFTDTSAQTFQVGLGIAGPAFAAGLLLARRIIRTLHSTEKAANRSTLIACVGLGCGAESGAHQFHRPLAWAFSAEGYGIRSPVFRLD